MPWLPRPPQRRNVGWAPQASVELTFGGGQPVRVDWSISTVGADDTPQQAMIHKAEQAGVDFVKEQMHPKIAEVISALKEQHPWIPEDVIVGKAND